MPQHIARPAQVEVGVIGEVHNRGAVGERPVVYLQGGVAQGIHHIHHQIARVALVAVGAEEAEGNGVRAAHFGVPEPPREAVRSPMQMVASVVRREGVSCAVEGEAGVRDAVRISPHDRAEVGVRREVAFQRVVPQRELAPCAVSVGRLHRDERRAQRHQAHAQIRAGEDKRLHLAPVG